MQRRLGLLAAVAVVLVCAVGTWIYFRFSRPVGYGPAGPFVPAEGFTKPWTTRSVFLVGLGDSVTAGFGARKGYGYFDRLVANPKDEYPEMQGICLRSVFPNLTATNLAISGSTSMEHVDRLLPRLPAANTEVIGIIVITTGGNDLIHNYGRTPPREGTMFGATVKEASPWVENFTARLESAITRIKANFPGGCHIFLANIYDPTDGVGDVQRAGLPAWPDGSRILAAYNEVIRQCATRHENVHLVDLHSVFLGHGIHCTQFWQRHYDAHDPRYWFGANLEDPNERGYDAIRRIFLLELSKVAPQLR